MYPAKPSPTAHSRSARQQRNRSSSNGRTAWLALQPEAEAFAELVEALAFWEEENGWSVLTQHESAENRLSKGLDVLTDPADVAAWIVVARPAAGARWVRGGLLG